MLPDDFLTVGTDTLNIHYIALIERNTDSVTVYLAVPIPEGLMVKTYSVELWDAATKRKKPVAGPIVPPQPL